MTAMSSSFHGPRVTAVLENSESKGQWVASFGWHYSYYLTVGFRENRIARCFILSSEANFPIRVVFEVLTDYFPCIQKTVYKDKIITLEFSQKPLTVVDTDIITAIINRVSVRNFEAFHSAPIISTHMSLQYSYSMIPKSLLMNKWMI